MQKNRFNEFRYARRFRLANRTVQIVLGLCLIASLNFLAAKYFGRIDLTQSGTYTLAPESKAYIRELEEPVEIIVTIPKDPDIPELVQIHQHLEKLFREYEATGMIDGEAHILVEYVDIYRQRKRAQEIATKYSLTQENIILVAKGDRKREIRQGDLYEVEGDQIIGFRGEKTITSAIIDVSSKDEDKIYFLVGHGEMRLDDVDPFVVSPNWKPFCGSAIIRSPRSTLPSTPTFRRMRISLLCLHLRRVCFPKKWRNYAAI